MSNDFGIGFIFGVFMAVIFGLAGVGIAAIRHAKERQR
jgi:hypothetical protein